MIDAGYLFSEYHERERTWLSQRVVTYPSTWFRSVVRSCWIDLLRYRSRVKRPDEHCSPMDEEEIAVVNPCDRALDILHARQELTVLLSVADLTDQERHVLLRRLNGDSYHELAGSLNVTENAVRAVYWRAVQCLQETAYERGMGV